MTKSPKRQRIEAYRITQKLYKLFYRYSMLHCIAKKEDKTTKKNSNATLEYGKNNGRTITVVSCSITT